MKALLANSFRSATVELQLFCSKTDCKKGYSAFEATNYDLEKYLKEKGIENLYVAGLATDYCVKISVLDALKAGFKTFVFTDAVRAVNVQPEDGHKAIELMIEAGAKFITSKEFSEPGI